MRKIILTILSTALMIGFTYIPLATQTISPLAVEETQAANDTCQTNSECGAGRYCSIDYGATVGECLESENVPPPPGENIPPPPGDNIPPPPGDNTPPDCTTKICNPLLPEYGTLCQVLTAVIRWITQIGALIAVVLIIWTGFLFVTAQGNPAKISKAKSAFLTTIIGTAILLGASAIAQIIVKTVFTITSQDNPGVCSI